MILNEFEFGQWTCLFIFFLIFLIFFYLKSICLSKNWENLYNG